MISTSVPDVACAPAVAVFHTAVSVGGIPVVASTSTVANVLAPCFCRASLLQLASLLLLTACNISLQAEVACDHNEVDFLPPVCSALLSLLFQVSLLLLVSPLQLVSLLLPVPCACCQRSVVGCYFPCSCYRALAFVGVPAAAGIYAFRFPERLSSNLVIVIVIFLFL